MGQDAGLVLLLPAAPGSCDLRQAVFLLLFLHPDTAALWCSVQQRKHCGK